MKELFDLFITFCRIGGLTFGGGYAMLPMLQREVVEKKRWVTEEEVLDYYAVGQCTPGIIAANTAMFIGYKIKGIAGAVAAVTGVAFPSVVIIMIIAGFIKNFTDLPIVQYAFAGIRVAVAVLVIDAIIKLWKSGIKDIVGIGIFLVAFIVSVLFNLSPVYIVIGAIFVGLMAKIIKEGK